MSTFQGLRGKVNGLASLDATIHIPAAQLPLATTAAVGGVSINSDGNLTISGAGVLDTAQNILTTSSPTFNGINVTASSSQIQLSGSNIFSVNGGNVILSDGQGNTVFEANGATQAYKSNVLWTPTDQSGSILDI